MSMIMEIGLNLRVTLFQNVCLGTPLALFSGVFFFTSVILDADSCYHQIGLLRPCVGPSQAYMEELDAANRFNDPFIGDEWSWSGWFHDWTMGPVVFSICLGCV